MRILQKEVRSKPSLDFSKEGALDYMEERAYILVFQKWSKLGTLLQSEAQ
jgi:hypothetical protein